MLNYSVAEIRYTKNITVNNNSLLKFILANGIVIDKPFVVNQGAQVEISF